MIKFWWSLVKLGFRLLYNELAFTYDSVSWIVSLGAWKCWQRKALEYLEPSSQGKILEIAHGTGTIQSDLNDLGYDTIGIDFSRNMGKITRQKLIRKQIIPQLARSKVQHLPFAPASFRAIITTFPTSFIVEEATLYELYRVLCDGGRLIIVPNATLTGGGIIKRFVQWLYRITGQRGDVMEAFTAHIGAFGFNTELMSANCSNSQVTVVIATKKV